MRQGYTRIPNALISDATLSLAARMVYVYIASQDKGWVFRPSVMERELGVERKYRLRLIKELITAGLIKREPVTGIRGVSCTYVVSVPNKDSNQPISVPNKDSEGVISVPNRDSDHLINIKNSVCDKNCARARDAHTQDSNSSAAPTDPNAALMKVFIDGTKKASDELHCPREMTVAFHEYWTATVADGRPLWATKQAFNFKQRLKTWMRHEQR